MIEIDMSAPTAKFWAKVKKVESGCWEWTAALDGVGYGKFGMPVGGRVFKTVKAHRYSYSKLVGPIPDGLVLDHLCRNRICVNPDHLEPVTDRVNLLRGVGLAAREAAQTHCKRGHEFTPENTRSGVTGRGTTTRVCRICSNALQNIRHAAKRAAAPPSPRKVRTACPNGHPYDPAVPMWSDGSRCQPCRQARARAAYLRRVASK